MDKKTEQACLRAFCAGCGAHQTEDRCWHATLPERRAAEILCPLRHLTHDVCPACLEKSRKALAEVPPDFLKTPPRFSMEWNQGEEGWEAVSPDGHCIAHGHDRSKVFAEANLYLNVAPLAKAVAKSLC